MAKFGLLINYEYCIGCGSCEIACKMEHNRPADEWGVRVQKARPGCSDGKIYYFPVPTDHCNLCGRRRAKGLEPSCVKHCLAGVMMFGKVDELISHLRRGAKYVLWTPH